MKPVILQMGQRGTIVVPAKLRKRLGLEDGCLLALVENEASFEIRKVEIPPAPADVKRSQAAKILSSAASLGEYLAAFEEVQKMGLDPDQIPHERFSS